MAEHVTDEFDRAFLAGGTDGPTQCQCGRHHVSSRSEDVESVAEYVEKAKAEPDKWFVHDDCGIGILDGIGHVVWGCPCGTDLHAERWLWERREMIAQYLRERSEREANEALSTAQKLRGIAGAIDTTPTDGAKGER